MSTVLPPAAALPLLVALVPLLPTVRVQAARQVNGKGPPQTGSQLAVRCLTMKPNISLTSSLPWSQPCRSGKHALIPVVHRRVELPFHEKHGMGHFASSGHRSGPCALLVPG